MPIKFKMMVLWLFIAVSLSLQAQNLDKQLVEQELTWRAIEGAWGYEVVIREGDTEIINTQIQEAQFNFSLPPGEYEFTIRTLNKFKKPVNSTDWKPLIIVEALQPVIRNFTPQKEFLKSNGNLVLNADVFQVKEETQFILLSSKNEEISGTVRALEKERVEIAFPMSALEPGEYVLSARDPSGLEDKASVIPLSLLPIIKPEIEDLSLYRIQQQQVYTDIEITGRNFDEGSQVKITRQGQEFLPYELERKSPELLIMSIITGDNPPGRYSLKVINPSGESDTKENSFFMEEAPAMEEIQYTPPAETSELLGGISFVAVADQSHGDSDPLFPGFVLKARQDLVNSRFWSSPGLRPLGVELSLDSSHLEYKNAPFLYHQLYMGLSVYYRIKLAGKWSLIPKLGIGVSTLWVNEEGLLGELVQGDSGYSGISGLSLQRELKSGWFMEGGIDYRETRYTGGYFNTFHTWLAGGLRF
jgi:hypothetical protein